MIDNIFVKFDDPFAKILSGPTDQTLPKTKTGSAKIPTKSQYMPNMIPWPHMSIV